MSISRKNWSALSTLARQWTVEDEEEIEREKRRKTRESAADGDESPTEEAKPQTSSNSESAEAGDAGGGLDQLQLDFVEMLRVRDERRRIRHVETLRKNKEEEDGDRERGLDEEPHVEVLEGEQNEELLKNIQQCVETIMSPDPPTNPAEAKTCKKQENGETKQDSISTNSQSSFKDSRNFVSSLSMSFDKSPSSPLATSRVVSPLSPRSPPPQSPGAEPPHSFTNSASMSPTSNGDQASHENGSESNTEAAAKPAFTRQSSRTVSFRRNRQDRFVPHCPNLFQMMKKKEEENMPLQRSASVRIAAKTFESNKNANQQEQQTPFQRNSRQRLSSRSIQEKMERLAQASQKWEISKSPSLDKTVCLADEVSRKRELFEKEQDAAEKSSFFSKQDLRHVNISTKKSLFERGQNQDHK